MVVGVLLPLCLLYKCFNRVTTPTRQSVLESQSKIDFSILQVLTIFGTMNFTLSSIFVFKLKNYRSEWRLVLIAEAKIHKRQCFGFTKHLVSVRTIVGIIQEKHRQQHFFCHLLPLYTVYTNKHLLCISLKIENSPKIYFC